MTDIIPIPKDPQRELEALLPWYASGSLEPDVREAVRAYIAQSPTGRDELADERRLASAMTELPAEGVPDVEDGWAAINRQLVSERDKAPVRTGFLAGRRRSGSGRRDERGPANRAWMGWAMAAQFAAIAFLGGLALHQPPSAGSYHTLSSAPPPAAGNIVVVFRPTASEQEIRGMLRATGARLVDGPTSTDAYLLHVAPAARNAALQTLRDRSEITLVQPVDED